MPWSWFCECWVSSQQFQSSPGKFPGQRSLTGYSHGVTKSRTRLSKWTTRTTWPWLWAVSVERRGRGLIWMCSWELSCKSSARGWEGHTAWASESNQPSDPALVPALTLPSSEPQAAHLTSLSLNVLSSTLHSPPSINFCTPMYLRTIWISIIKWRTDGQET